MSKNARAHLDLLGEPRRVPRQIMASCQLCELALASGICLVCGIWHMSYSYSSIDMDIDMDMDMDMGIKI